MNHFIRLASVVVLAPFAIVGCDSRASRVATAEKQIYDLKQAVGAYSIDFGVQPETLNQLMLSSHVKGDRVYPPYIATAPVDPWGKPYAYRPNTHLEKWAEIFSAGPNGLLGDSDDVRSDDAAR